MFQSMKVSRIDIPTLERIHVFWREGFEVRVGEDYRKDLSKLQYIRPQLEKEIADLEYVDLRFQNIVAKKKEKNKR